MKKLMVVAVSVSLFLAGALPVTAFGAEGCGVAPCGNCHTLDAKEAGGILASLVDKVNKVEQSEVPGLWLVEVEKGTNKLPVYIDFSKKYVISGSVLRLADRSDVTMERFSRMNRIDTGRIPLDDALLLGSKKAKTRVIVFTDPECPYCKQLHVELQEVVRRDPDIAFLIKLFPLKMHPNAYATSRSIVCSRSLEMLELSFAGKPVPPAACDSKAVDQTLALVSSLGIQSTPTLVLPNGLVAPGFKRADDLLKLIRQEQTAAR